MKIVRLLFVLPFILGSSLSKSADLFGAVTAPNGDPVCALVLASGRSVFSCNPIGQYSMSNLPLESDGSIKLAVYADGFRPYAQRLTSFGQVPVTLVRQYDDGLSDRGSLNGVYRLMRFIAQGNDGWLIDTDYPNVSASGTLTITSDTITRDIRITENGEVTTDVASSPYSDAGAKLEIFEDGIFYDVPLIERGRKTVTFYNGNLYGSPGVIFEYWIRVSSVAPSVFSVKGVDESATTTGGGLGTLIERIRY